MPKRTKSANGVNGTASSESPHESKPFIITKGLEKAYGSGATTVSVLRGVDLQVNSGQLVALYGPSGSGKTTLLNLVGALDMPTAGSITIGDVDITKLNDNARSNFRRTQLGFIFQNYTLLPTYSAVENIDLALRLLRIKFRQRKERATTALSAVGLSAWSDHVPDELSGGQRQRITIARALAMQPKLILADEPTSGLDTATTRRILTLFRAIAQSRGTTFLIVSHDVLVSEYVDAAYDLYDGKLIPRKASTALMSMPSAIASTMPPPNEASEQLTPIDQSESTVTESLTTLQSSESLVKETQHEPS